MFPHDHPRALSPVVEHIGGPCSHVACASQVMKLIEAKKRKEKEVEAKALENAQMRIEIESMRKKMRRSSRGLLTANNRLEHLPLKPSRFCRRQTAISTKMMYAVLPLHHLYRTNSDQGYLARQRKDLRITPKVSIVSPAVAHEISIGDNEDIPESLNAFRPSRVAFYHAAVAAVQDAGVGCTCVYTTGNAVGVHDSSHTPHIWKTSVGRKRKNESWAREIERPRYATTGFVPAVPTTTPTDTIIPPASEGRVYRLQHRGNLLDTLRRKGVQGARAITSDLSERAVGWPQASVLPFHLTYNPT